MQYIQNLKNTLPAFSVFFFSPFLSQQTFIEGLLCTSQQAIWRFKESLPSRRRDNQWETLVDERRLKNRYCSGWILRTSQNQAELEKNNTSRCKVRDRMWQADWVVWYNWSLWFAYGNSQRERWRSQEEPACVRLSWSQWRVRKGFNCQKWHNQAYPLKILLWLYW